MSKSRRAATEIIPCYIPWTSSSYQESHRTDQNEHTVPGMRWYPTWYYYCAYHPTMCNMSFNVDHSSTFPKENHGNRLVFKAQHSTAQHSTISLHKAALQPSADQSAKPLGSRQRWREPAHIVEHIYSALISQNERRIRTLPGLQNFTTTHTALM